jgi:hypothetical protein
VHISMSRAIWTPSQIRWLRENGYSSLIAYEPKSDVKFLVRYLYLKIPSQRRKLLPLLKSEAKHDLQKILDGYKRAHKLNVGITRCPLDLEKIDTHNSH